MKRDGVGEHPTQIDSNEPGSVESELRGQGLQVLARLIARSHMQLNSVEHNTDSYAACQENVSIIVKKRSGHAINREDSQR